MVRAYLKWSKRSWNGPSVAEKVPTKAEVEFGSANVYYRLEFRTIPCSYKSALARSPPGAGEKAVGDLIHYLIFRSCYPGVKWAKKIKMHQKVAKIWKICWNFAKISKNLSKKGKTTQVNFRKWYPGNLLTQLPASDLGTSSGTRVSATWHKWPNSQSSSVLESYLSRSEAPRWNGEALPVDVHVTLLLETTYELLQRVHVVDVVFGQPRPTGQPSKEWLS